MSDAPNTGGEQDTLIRFLGWQGGGLPALSPLPLPTYNASMSDTIIIGGGVIGLSLAWELTRHGQSVLVLERGEFGREASWAGAGMLPPGNPVGAVDPMARLQAESHLLWPDWSESITSASGVDNGYARCGAVEVPLSPEHLEQMLAEFESEGVAHEALHDSSGIRGIEPRVNPGINAAIHLPEYGQIRNPRHLKALVAACGAHGVELVGRSPVVGFETDEERVKSVRTEDTTYAADQVCVCGGAWSAAILQEAGVTLPVEPVRGQIVQLSTQPPLLRSVVQQGPRYVVPRADGRILIGATEEWVGFEKLTTAEAVSDLLQFATSLIPALADARFEQAWSGLRPGNSRGRPFMDRLPDFENLFVAAGHFRAGLQTSPATAVFMRQLMLEQETLFRVDEFATDSSSEASRQMT